MIKYVLKMHFFTNLMLFLVRPAVISLVALILAVGMYIPTSEARYRSNTTEASYRTSNKLTQHVRRAKQKRVYRGPRYSIRTSFGTRGRTSYLSPISQRLQTSAFSRASARSVLQAEPDFTVYEKDTYDGYRVFARASAFLDRDGQVKPIGESIKTQKISAQDVAKKAAAKRYQTNTFVRLGKHPKTTRQTFYPSHEDFVPYRPYRAD